MFHALSILQGIVRKKIGFVVKLSLTVPEYEDKHIPSQWRFSESLIGSYIAKQGITEKHKDNQNLIDQGRHFGKCCFKGSVSKMKAK